MDSQMLDRIIKTLHPNRLHPLSDSRHYASHPRRCPDYLLRRAINHPPPMHLVPKD